jgi:hypothetical protein
MAGFLRFIGARLKSFFSAQILLSPPTFGQVRAGLSILGVLGLGYLCGAAIMFFQLPSADFLEKAFRGASAWYERGRSTLPPLSPEAEAVARKREGITVDKAEKTCDGFTLYTASDGPRATLIDMRGTVVHRWELPFRQAWTHPPHIEDPLPDDTIHWFRGRLYANGDLLAVYHAGGDTPYGYGLVKVDKDSKLLWAYANRCHHDVDVGEDGTIYTLTQKIVSQPSAGREKSRPVHLLADFLVVLSPEGQELESIPLLEILRDSPYALTLSSVTKHSAARIDFGAAAKKEGSYGKGGPLHANSVRVLPRALAAKFPLFKPGQVLISLRDLDTLAVVDPQSRSVVWASEGIWHAQHDAEFLENGRLLVYDNLGSANKTTRIIEYDPLTQAVPWCYANENSTSFSAFMRGVKQRLPNGNTFIVDPDNRRLFEVTRDKELVWEIICPLPPAPPGQHSRAHAINSARRYGAGELSFLKGVARARP